MTSRPREDEMRDQQRSAELPRDSSVRPAQAKKQKIVVADDENWRNSYPIELEATEKWPPSQDESRPFFSQLTGVQRAIIQRFTGILDTSSDSVVITNPLAPSSPIVFVTKAWQKMCGYSMNQAVGQNPRLTQGEHTDQDTIKGMGIALSEQKSCKVRLINYRGYNKEPFWNCLSVHPIFYNNNLVLHVAYLSDYSYRLSRLVTHVPSQFCLKNQHFQTNLRLSSLGTSSQLTRASRLHVSSDDVREEGEEGKLIILDSDSSDEKKPKLPGLHVKRLGFFKLELEPMYLVDRLIDECSQLELPCHANLASAVDGEVYCIHVGSSATNMDNPVTAAIHVIPEDIFGRYNISITRMKGDTFAFHALYRSLRKRLDDLQESS
ncbi:MAG: hypothetical protein SGPRY_002023 [Prymnesium sp.]